MAEPPSNGTYDLDDLTVVMGTYNEAAAIGRVLEDVDAATDGRASVVCVDSSTDGTARIAREHGAYVVEQPPMGYGVALLAGLETADRPVVVTTDCDDTYPMERIPDFLDAINAGHDVVSGDRLTRGAATMPPVNRLGNRLFAGLASLLCARRIRDTTTGMRAYRKEVIEAIEWTENTGLSAELLLRPLLRGYDVVELPIDYRERAGETTLDPLAGGLAIGRSIVTVCLEERLR
jgi:glycosyltransferase involved in cell wall biosynthesis